MRSNVLIGPVLVLLLLAGVYLAVRLAGRPVSWLRTVPWLAAAWRRGEIGLGWVTTRVAPSILILLVGSLLVFGLASVFVEILDAVVDKDDLTVIDRPVLDWLASHRSATLNAFVNSVTDLGSMVFLAPAIAVTAFAVAWRLHSWQPIWITAITLGGAQVLVFAIKVLIARPRPDFVIPDVVAYGFSFPSGHAASSLAGYGMIAWLICMTTKRGIIWATAWLSALGLALAIGLSRVYLSVHYPSDVIGGWLLGITWLATVAVAVSVATTRLNSTRQRHGDEIEA